MSVAENDPLWFIACILSLRVPPLRLPLGINVRNNPLVERRATKGTAAMLYPALDGSRLIPGPTTIFLLLAQRVGQARKRMPRCPK